MKTASGANTVINRFMSQAAQPRPKVSTSERPSARVASVDWSAAMILNLHAWTTIGCAAALSSAEPLAAQTPCPPRADSILAAGWRAYRADSTAKAKERFEEARRLCPQNADGWVGLGFTKLRLGDAKAADDLFTQVLSRDATNTDAWEGRTRSSLRLGDTTRAIAFGQRVLRLNPDNRE